ncbi:MAG: hypothetical protein LBK28_00385 [Propionibacteriaceae bacterium]|jgi:hypothetical protein|nr:hypothetical protein [Propionibacteriaceae bacterium]
MLLTDCNHRFVNNAGITGLALSHLLSVAVARHLSAVPPIATMPLDELVQRVAPSVQLNLESGQR